MTEFKWDPLKSQRLKRTRGVSFEEIVASRLVDVRQHPKKEHQKILVYEHKGYYWAVPYVLSEEGVFLKTIYPSRKWKKLYQKRGHYEKDQVDEI